MPMNNIWNDLNFISGSFEEWELLEKIGEGTYGEVFKARHRYSDQLVAIKILDIVPGIYEEIDEYAIMRDLCNHPNLPKFYGLYVKHSDINYQLWIAMELCSGGSVSDFVKICLSKGFRIDEKMIAYIIKETLKALFYLHCHRVIHRDIKGQNILLTSNGLVKLLDFGVSAHLKSVRDRRNTSVGTPYWMAPEVIACEQHPYEYDVRCDIWSLGITVIELVDGRPPLFDQHPMKALFHTVRHPAPTVAEPALWSENLKDFIAQCLVKDFEKRPFCEQLFQHPFILQVPDDTSEIQYQIQTLLHKIEMQDQAETDTYKETVRELPPHDLTKLEQLTEDIIVTALKERYHNNTIYTYVGDILVAINPFVKFDIYNAEHASLYCGALLASNPPHIFAVADQSYQAMLHSQKNQCIIINGESGAGKTESAHFLLQHMTRLGQALNRDLEQKLAHINPLVEAFGNAQTVINGNSSRFGKYLELIFTTSGKVTGARLSEYLLEKSRVIRQAKGEKNFHIFYYFLDNVKHSQDEYLKTLVNIDSNSTWRYLEQRSSSPVPGEKSDYLEVLNGFEVVGFTAQEIQVLMSLLAAILLLGNIVFDECEKEHHTGSVVSSQDTLQQVASLLGVSSQELHSILTSVVIVASGETIVRSNSVHDAGKVRDSISKAIYGRLFDWIVNKINQNLCPANLNNMLNIGILDIFGFENFERNSFEQLCINITNEQLQYFFNQHVFATELKEYEEEGLNGMSVTFTNNQSTLDLFLSKPLGLLAILDEESNFPKATDHTLLAKFQQNIRNMHFAKAKGGDLLFSIDHYAEKVEYDAVQFLEKNQDRLPAEVLTVLSCSQVALVKALFNLPINKTGNLIYQSLGQTNNDVSNKFSVRTATNVHRTTTQTLNTPTVATFFRNSLAELMSKIATGRPYFVRCIRPNVTNTAGVFDDERVMRQLQYTGMLETVRIRRQGYSHRVTFHEFLQRYSVLGFKLSAETNLPSTPSELCQLLLERIGLVDWAIGRSKVFLKYYHEDQLRHLIREKELRVVRIQSCVRCVVAVIKYKRMKTEMNEGALQIQRAYRGYMARKQCKEEKRKRQLMMWAVTILQKNYRMLKAKAERTRRQMDRLVTMARRSIASRSSTIDAEPDASPKNASSHRVLNEVDSEDSFDNVIQDGDSISSYNMEKDVPESNLKTDGTNASEIQQNIASSREIGSESTRNNDAINFKKNVHENTVTHIQYDAITNNDVSRNVSFEKDGTATRIYERGMLVKSANLVTNGAIKKRPPLTRRISFKGMRAENSDPHIEDEHPAYVNEVRSEHDKHNLVHQLALQRRQSARAKFHRHQKIINSQHKVEMRRQQLEKRQSTTDDSDGGGGGSDRKSNGGYSTLDNRIDGVGATRRGGEYESENGTYNFRGILRKTNFDPEDRQIKSENGTSQLDFRGVLKSNSRTVNRSFLYK